MPDSFAWNEVPEEPVTEGIVRQTVHGASQTLVRYRYEPGAVFPVHRHPQEQITVVLSGEIVFELDGVERRCGPGSVLVIPGDVPHGARVTGESAVETINALSPRREQSPRLNS